MWLCLWRWVDVGLLYHGIGGVADFPVFSWGLDFFRASVRYPGDLARYIAALLAQTLHASWLGAGVLTLQAWFICQATAAACRAMRRPELTPASFVPAILLVALYGRYAHFAAGITMLAVGLGAAWLYGRLHITRIWLKLVLLAIAAVVLYSAAGVALFVFALMVSVVTARGKGSWSIALSAWLHCALVPLIVGCFLFGLNAYETFEVTQPVAFERHGFSDARTWLLLSVYTAPLLLAGILAAHSWMSRRKHAPNPLAEASEKPLAATPSPGKTKPPQARRPHPSVRAVLSIWASPGQRWALETAALVMLMLGALYWSHDRRFKSVLAVERCVERGRWSEVPVAALANPNNVYVTAARVQADYHLGRLTQEFPQVLKPTDLLLAEQARRANWNQAMLYFDLGYVNLALHHLAEAQEFCGPRPAILRRLAVVNLALTNLPTARIYLNALTRVPFHASWARDYLARLDTDPALSGDEEVNRLRRFTLRQNSIRLVWKSDEVLEQLLEANPTNRMALEYLATYHLLSKNLNGFVRTLKRWNGLSTNAVPAVWEEALLLAATQPGAPPDLRERTFAPHTRQRLQATLAALQQSGSDATAAAQRLLALHGRSYFYHYFLHE
jgi:hypothetical protein